MFSGCLFDLRLDDYLLLVFAFSLPLIGGMFILSETRSGSDKCSSALDGGDSQRPQADVRRDNLPRSLQSIDPVPGEGGRINCAGDMGVHQHLGGVL